MLYVWAGTLPSSGPSNVPIDRAQFNGQRVLQARRVEDRTRLVHQVRTSDVDRNHIALPKNVVPTGVHSVPLSILTLEAYVERRKTAFSRHPRRFGLILAGKWDTLL